MIYINALALDNQLLAKSIIETALCVVVKTYKRDPKDFEIILGPGTGVVTLRSKAAKVNGKRVTATYTFQKGYKIDGVIEWKTISAGSVHEIVVKNLATDVITYFRKKVGTTKGGTSDWCKEKSTHMV
jgi:hypothetical protein